MAPAEPLAALRRRNLAGIAWMVLAMAGFALEDGLIKHLAAGLPVGQIMILFGLGGAAVFALSFVGSGVRLLDPGLRSRAMAWRAAFEVLGRSAFVLAVAWTPLSTTTAILQATPVLIVAGAIVFFGERAGPWRWSAVVLGLVGVLIVLDPRADDVTPLSVLALAGMAGFAGRDLATRAAPASLGLRHFGLTGFLTLSVAGALVSWLVDGGAWRAVDLPQAAALAACLVCGLGAYLSLMTAMRTGEVVAVTPFRYTRLLFGVALGVIAFGETPGARTLWGSALIVAAGLLVMLAPAPSPRPSTDVSSTVP